MLALSFIGHITATNTTTTTINLLGLKYVLNKSLIVWPTLAFVADLKV
jgi:hypothetical protein